MTSVTLNDMDISNSDNPKTSPTKRLGADKSAIFGHFSSYFRALVAKTPTENDAAYLIRHNVFCDELHVFDSRDTGLESDHFDHYAEQILIQHVNTLEYCGCVRLILPEEDSMVLPIEQHGVKYFERQDLLPQNFKRNELAEISRIAIPKQFRRRKIDRSECAATTGIDIHSYNEEDIRCFPFIGIGLYLACAALLNNRGKKHVYFMAEPKLGLSMQFIGLKMTQLGPEFDYVGRRVPYYINTERFVNEVKPSFKYMLANLSKFIK